MASMPKIKKCGRCGSAFAFRYGAEKYCDLCKPLALADTQKRGLVAYRERKKKDPEWRQRRTEQTRDYAKRNPEKVSEYQKEYAERRSGHKKQTAADWRARNRESYLAAARDRYRGNREQILAANKSPRARARRQKWERERRLSDPGFVIDDRMSVNIRLAIKQQKSGRGWEQLVGYTLADLMRHLERQFVKGMSWDNLGEWHIDHIIPKAAFSYSSPDDDQFRACWAITNLRPLWAAANISKRAKREVLL